MEVKAERWNIPPRSPLILKSPGALNVGLVFAQPDKIVSVQCLEHLDRRPDHHEKFCIGAVPQNARHGNLRLNVGYASLSNRPVTGLRAPKQPLIVRLRAYP